MTMSPSWDLVPEHYHYLAQDECGRWYAFKNKPEPNYENNEWIEETYSHELISESDEETHNWDLTLIYRHDKRVSEEYMEKVRELL